MTTKLRFINNDDSLQKRTAPQWIAINRNCAHPLETHLLIFRQPKARSTVFYVSFSLSSAIPIFDNRYRSAFRESPSKRAA